MVIHKIDGNSTWVEPMNTWTEGEIILDQEQALKQIQQQGIVHKH